MLCSLNHELQYMNIASIIADDIRCVYGSCGSWVSACETYLPLNVHLHNWQKHVFISFFLPYSLFQLLLQTETGFFFYFSLNFPVRSVIWHWTTVFLRSYRGHGYRPYHIFLLVVLFSRQNVVSWISIFPRCKFLKINSGCEPSVRDVFRQDRTHTCRLNKWAIGMGDSTIHEYFLAGAASAPILPKCDSHVSCGSRYTATSLNV